MTQKKRGEISAVKQGRVESDLRVRLGTGQALLAPTAAVIVQPGHEYLPGPVRSWL